jgi:hypothetical protein
MCLVVEGERKDEHQNRNRKSKIEMESEKEEARGLLIFAKSESAEMRNWLVVCPEDLRV